MPPSGGQGQGLLPPVLTMSPFLRCPGYLVSPAAGSKNVRWFKSAYLNYIWFVQGKLLSVKAALALSQC